MDPVTTTTKDLLVHIEKIIQEGNYADSVHKIKLMTTRDMIKKILQSEF